MCSKSRHNEVQWMEKAVEVALKSGADCPIGSVIVFDDHIIAEAHNEVEKLYNPTAHSEILCISRACEVLGSKILDRCVLYCTLEPCSMCLHAIKLAKIKRVVFGAFRDEEDQYKLDYIGGVLQPECSQILTDFFRRVRIKV